MKNSICETLEIMSNRGVARGVQGHVSPGAKGRAKMNNFNFTLNFDAILTNLFKILIRFNFGAQKSS